ncbi:hypothetical protein BDW22DRAFT_852705 [Trametopsis cervina]|nr:hypothetical protein BDW22DRAFT_852705 [Trametopsis cervina]
MRDSEEASAVNDFPRDKDSNDYELTGRDDVLRTQPDTVDDRHSEAIIDEASPAADATSSPPARDEKQEPSPPDPDTIRDGSPPLLPDIDVTDSSSQDANLDHSNGGHSSAAATSGVVPEAADPLAEPAADNAQTGLSGAVASTHERSSYRSQNDIGLSPASAPPESVSEGFPDIHPSVVTDGQQTRDSTSASGIFSARGVGDVEATRNDGQTFDAAHSEHGRGAVRDDDRLQFLDGGDDVVPREGVEDEEDT